jgi:TRAP-type mannitol/chloroaromatic compound transport system substrate-binding protein
MQASWMLKATFAFGASLAVGLAAASADAQNKVRWKMHSAFGGKLAILGTSGAKIEQRMDRISGGSFQLKFYEPGALIPALQYYDAVGQGSVDAGWGAAGFYVAKNPAYAFFSSVPFGPGVGEYVAWMVHGGGSQLHNELLAKDNIKSLICGILPPEASGWFRKEITSIDQLRGLKMRFYGLGARVMEKFGVSTQLLAPGDIYPALELGAIDATELSVPLIDEGLGFFQVAKHYYFPGWHQQSTLADLLVNKKQFDELSDSHKAALETVCGYQVYANLAEGEATQFDAMKRIQDKGVTLHTWSPEILDAYRKAWEEVIVEETAKSADMKKIHDSYSQFRASYAIWKDRGYLK